MGEKADAIHAKAVFDNVVSELRAAGYDPKAQLLGYLKTGDAGFITRRNGTRTKIQQIEKSELLALFIDEFS